MIARRCDNTLLRKYLSLESKYVLILSGHDITHVEIQAENSSEKFINYSPPDIDAMLRLLSYGGSQRRKGNGPIP